MPAASVYIEHRESVHQRPFPAHRQIKDTNFTKPFFKLGPICDFLPDLGRKKLDSWLLMGNSNQELTLESKILHQSHQVHGR